MKPTTKILLVLTGLVIGKHRRRRWLRRLLVLVVVFLVVFVVVRTTGLTLRARAAADDSVTVNSWYGYLVPGAAGYG
ncbi:MAG: hypothetical protein WA809_00275 [Candidatus Dormiibacterota bacterium]